MTWPNAAAVALVAGCLVGLLDIGMAALINLVSPIIVLKAIASGLLGKPAFAGGAPVVMLGLFLQLLMSTVMAAFYILASRHIPGLLAHPWRWGPAYGVVIFVVMNAIVVPLSAVPQLPKVTLYWFLANGAAMLAFGTILALLVRHGMKASS